MPKQFENSEATKLEDDTISDKSAEKKTEHVAEKAAEKASNTEKQYDRNHPPFSK